MQFIAISCRHHCDAPYWFFLPFSAVPGRWISISLGALAMYTSWRAFLLLTCLVFAAFGEAMHTYTRDQLLALRCSSYALSRGARKTLFRYNLWLPASERTQNVYKQSYGESRDPTELPPFETNNNKTGCSKFLKNNFLKIGCLNACTING